MSAFTPLSGLLGGSLIGLSAATLLLFNGDILGASGIASSFFLNPRKTLTESSQSWKLPFVAAFLLSVQLYVRFVGEDAIVDSQLGVNPDLAVVSQLGYWVSGFLVGFGTRLGNGCTSGHGICGLARFSKRSFAAVCSFMATGILSASACSPMCPLSPYLRGTADDVALPNATTRLIGTIFTSVFVGMTLPRLLQRRPSLNQNVIDVKTEAIRVDQEVNHSRKLWPAMASGSLFSVGLIISGMVKQFKIYGFLNFKGFASGTWDGTLLFVMGGGFLISLLSYQFVPDFNYLYRTNPKTLSCPLSQAPTTGKFGVPTNTVIDANLIFGAAIFGLGWGIGGMCPGPAMVNAVAGFPHVLYRWWPAFAVGSFLGQKLKDVHAR